MADERFDAIVIGGGPGGYVCTIRLGQLGLKAACVESEEVGGICLNWGCIPSKVLISTAHLYLKAQHSTEFGLRCTGVELDLGTLQDKKQDIVKKLTSGVRSLLRANRATLVEGHAEVIDAKSVRVTSGQGTSSTLTATRGLVIATGSSTLEIPGFPFDGERILGARDAVSLRRVPPRLLVIGGGVIGLELGMLYQALGSELTVVELLPSLLSTVDPECVKVIHRRISQRGGRIFTHTGALGQELQPDGSTLVRLQTADGPTSVECDLVLVAVGMRPRSGGIGLESLGVELDSRGFIRTNQRCETNVPGVYAIGDVSGLPLLAHKASKEGEVCAEVIAGHHSAKDWVSVPAVVFTDPEIASSGMSEQQAAELGRAVKVGRFPFSALGRAMSLGETDGFVKVVSDPSSGRVLGVHIVGPAASDLVSEVTLGLELGVTAEDMAMTIHPHPTLSEAVMEASEAAVGHAIHIINR
jgi:dihydrolipoamide dehydrogenase